MPRRHELTVCAQPGCPTLATYRGRCDKHRTDHARPNSTARGYDARWTRTRAAYLAAHPTCECDQCLELPLHARPRAADVHHRDGLGPLGPRGHDWTNLQALTHEHHSQQTSRDQPGGFNTR